MRIGARAKATTTATAHAHARRGGEHVSVALIFMLKADANGYIMMKGGHLSHGEYRLRTGYFPGLARVV